MRLTADSFRDAHVLVIGDLALDRFVYGDVERISPEAPVPVIRVRSTRSTPGCAANVAANIAALGARATLIGVVGTDAEAGELGAVLATEFKGIDFMPVADEGRQTVIKTRYIAGGQQVVRADLEDSRSIDAEVEARVLDAFAAALPECDVVVVSDYSKGMLTDRVLRAVIEQANAAGRPVLVDPKRTRLADYRGATLIKPNRRELRVATGLPCDSDEQARVAADQVVAETGAMVLLTRSEQGMSLFRAGAEPMHARAEQRQVFDVSGAGDTVIAVVAAAVAAGLDTIAALNIANVAAGIVVGKIGTATVSAVELAQTLDAARRGFDSRIVDLATAVRQREEWRQQGLVVGFTNGCFDLIHPGHVSLLAQAARACDRLVVALNSDASVRRLKGPQRPLQVQEARAYVMASIEHVDLVTLFDADTPLALVAALRPDVLIKGSDYQEDEIVGADLVRSWGGRVVRAGLVPEQSTTSLVRRSRQMLEPALSA